MGFLGGCLAISGGPCYNGKNHSEEEKEYARRSESGTVQAGQARKAFRSCCLKLR